MNDTIFHGNCPSGRDINAPKFEWIGSLRMAKGFTGRVPLPAMSDGHLRGQTRGGNMKTIQYQLIYDTEMRSYFIQRFENVRWSTIYCAYTLWGAKWLFWRTVRSARRRARRRHGDVVIATAEITL